MHHNYKFRPKWKCGAHVMTAIAINADAIGPDSQITYAIRVCHGFGIFSIDSKSKIEFYMFILNNNN